MTVFTPARFLLASSCKISLLAKIKINKNERIEK